MFWANVMSAELCAWAAEGAGDPVAVPADGLLVAAW
jgi:hypothetical protein